MKRTKILGGGVRNLLVLTLAIVIALSSVCMVSAKDTITITKKWDDGLTGVDAANRDAPKVVVTATMSRSEMLDLFYPVGTCYVTVDNSFNPNEAWGGTWVKLSEGQNVIQAGSTFTFGSTGGNKDAIVVSHKHTASGGAVQDKAAFNTGGMSANETHSHNIKWNNYNRTYTSANNPTVGYISPSASQGSGSTGSSSVAHTHQIPAHGHGFTQPTISTEGSSGTNANMQPYVAGNIWKRTA